jgi:hypothetical protein
MLYNFSELKFSKLLSKIKYFHLANTWRAKNGEAETGDKILQNILYIQYRMSQLLKGHYHEKSDPLSLRRNAFRPQKFIAENENFSYYPSKSC